LSAPTIISCLSVLLPWAKTIRFGKPCLSLKYNESRVYDRMEFIARMAHPGSGPLDQVRGRLGRRRNPAVFHRLHRSKRHWTPVSTGVTSSEGLRKYY